MQWTSLLSTRRTRELEGGRPGSRSARDPRSEFDKDYDRSLFSTPVRRLQDKAQVFPLDPSDFIRTRLTHSLEVSTVAGGLAASVAAWLVGEKEIDRDQASHIHKIARTCGLIHDIGNPPFGHAGEDAMQEWFRSLLLGGDNRAKKLLAELGGRKSATVQDFCRFDGNAQTMRPYCTCRCFLTGTVLT
jgi:dGTPase